jgi:hypothetical protein
LRVGLGRSRYQTKQHVEESRVEVVRTRDEVMGREVSRSED